MLHTSKRDTNDLQCLNKLALNFGKHLHTFGHDQKAFGNVLIWKFSYFTIQAMEFLFAPLIF